MDYQRRYKGLIWTNHALQRLKERGIPQSLAWAAFTHPTSSRYAAAKGGVIYTRTWPDKTVKVVAKKNERGEWLILSVWSSPSASQKFVSIPMIPVLLVLLILLVLLVYAYVR